MKRETYFKWCKDMGQQGVFNKAVMQLLVAFPVVIERTNERGPWEWAVVSAGDLVGSFWLGAFETQDQADQFCDDLELEVQ